MSVCLQKALEAQDHRHSFYTVCGRDLFWATTCFGPAWAALRPCSPEVLNTGKKDSARRCKVSLTNDSFTGAAGGSQRHRSLTLHKAKEQKSLQQILTHRLELPDELLFCPLCPFLLVCVYRAQDGAAWLPAVLDGRDVQVVHQHDVWVLQREHSRSYTIGPLSAFIFLIRTRKAS